MTVTVYDRVARAVLRTDPQELLAWLLGVPGELRFVRWLDAHLGDAESAERTADALAHVTNEADGGRPWLLLVESQTRPDAEMFGRVMEYLGGAWRREKPEDLPGDRFAVAAVVIHLTGEGRCFPAVAWPGARLRSGEVGREVNLSLMDAGAVLDQVEAGAAPRAALAWIPLMKRGGEPGIIGRWRAIAGRETDRRVRSAPATAVIFADLTDCRPAWEEGLMTIPYTESPFINECIDKALKARMVEVEKSIRERLEAVQTEGKKEGITEGSRGAARQAVLANLRDRFQAVPDDLGAAVGGVADLDRLEELRRLSVTADSLDAFRRGAGL